MNTEKKNRILPIITGLLQQAFFKKDVPSRFKLKLFLIEHYKITNKSLSKLRSRSQTNVSTQIKHMQPALSAGKQMWLGFILLLSIRTEILWVTQLQSLKNWENVDIFLFCHGPLSYQGQKLLELSV